MVFSFLKKSVENKNTEKYFRTSLYVSFGTMVVALALSFLHLNQPFRSIYALSNIQTSWLSREILTASLFLFLIALTAFLYHLKRTSSGVINKMILATAVAGVLFIYSMSRIYMIPTVPAWNNPTTITGFFATTLVLGSALALSLYSKNVKGSLSNEVKDKFPPFLESIILLAVLIKIVNYLLISPEVSSEMAGFPAQPLAGIIPLLHWVFLLIGVSLIAAGAFRKNEIKNYNIFFIAFGCFFVSEFFDRVVFYASYFRIGL